MNIRVNTVNSRTRLSEAELCSWLGTSTRGDRIIYHRGHLAIDLDASSSRLRAVDRAELKRVARRAMWAAELGIVHLFQHRHGLHDYSYIVITRAKKRGA